VFLNRRDPSVCERGRNGPTMGPTTCPNTRHTRQHMRQPVLRHCYSPLRIHKPYMTPYEARSMRELAALRMVWASAAWTAVEMLAT
jgi:hypothetical protein